MFTYAIEATMLMIRRRVVSDLLPRSPGRGEPEWLPTLFNVSRVKPATGAQSQVMSSDAGNDNLGIEAMACQNTQVRSPRCCTLMGGHNHAISWQLRLLTHP